MFEAVYATAGLGWGSGGMGAHTRTQKERAAGRKSIYVQVSREQHEFVKCIFESPNHFVTPYVRLG
jgi:hypothetical protein